MTILSKVLKKTSATTNKTFTYWNHATFLQFGFRESHSSLEHVHRTVNIILEGNDLCLYCSAAFVGVQQASDKFGILLFYTKKRITIISILPLPRALHHLPLFLNNRKTNFSLFIILSLVASPRSVLGAVFYIPSNLHTITLADKLQLLLLIIITSGFTISTSSYRPATTMVIQTNTSKLQQITFSLRRINFLAFQINSI